MENMYCLLICTLDALEIFEYGLAVLYLAQSEFINTFWIL